MSFDQAEGMLGIAVPRPELDVAFRALARPAADIAARVRQSWSTLVASGTTVQQAAQILGVEAPPAGEPCR